MRSLPLCSLAAAALVTACTTATEPPVPEPAMPAASDGHYRLHLQSLLQPCGAITTDGPYGPSFDSFSYDSSGHEVKDVTTLAAPDTYTNTSTTSWTHAGAVSSMHSVTSQGESMSTYDLVESYDSQGHNTLEATRGQGSGSADATEDDTFSEFDAEGDYGKIVIHRIDPGNAAPDNDVTVIHTHAYTYDGQGRTTSQINTDEQGAVTYTLHVTHDDVHLTETTATTSSLRNASGAAVPYTDLTVDTYDADHEWLAETDTYTKQGEAPVTIDTVNTWDGGRLLTTVVTSGGTVSWSERYLYACPAGWQASTATAAEGGHTVTSHRRLAHVRTDALRQAAR